MIQATKNGPLDGVRVVEFAGLGPGPFACMLLSDMGADVVTIDRPTRQFGDRTNITGRGRSVVLADLKDPAQLERVLQMTDACDVVVEGFRPGVMERLGLGPGQLRQRNPRLVYARMTGWGQTGPLAQAAGHDINYISISGALHAIGEAGRAPVPPLNLVGDFGGGGMFLVVGVLAALHERTKSGLGQVIDAAMTDGVITLMTNILMQQLRGAFTEERGSNLLDGGAPFYGTYMTADSEYISIAPLEPQFYALLCEKLEMPKAFSRMQHDRAQWPKLSAEFARVFASQPRSYWIGKLESTDVCFAPVLALSEAQMHPHNVARCAYTLVDGINQPSPAPRFSRTPSRIQGPAPSGAACLDDILKLWTGRPMPESSAAGSENTA